MAHYSSVDYWTTRYKQITGPFDWYLPYLGTKLGGNTNAIDENGGESSMSNSKRPSSAASSASKGGVGGGGSRGGTPASSQGKRTTNNSRKQSTAAKSDETAADGAAGGGGAGESGGPHSTELRDNLITQIPKTARILIAGCGTSLMPEQLYDDGCTNIVAADFCEKAIEYMEARRTNSLPEPESEVQRSLAALHQPGGSGGGASAAHHQPKYQRVREICYTCADLKSVPQFDNGTFDFIVDKAMLDAAFCGVDMEKQKEHVEEIVAELYRLLKPGGKLIHLTHTSSTEGLRSVIFDSAIASWGSVTMTKIAKEGVHDILSASESVQFHYLYTLSKPE